MEKKKFECPEAIIITFGEDDIILTSNSGAFGNWFSEEPGDHDIL